MYTEITDIWVRYRVHSVTVTATFYPTISGNLVGVMYPYRSSGAPVNTFQAVMTQPGVISKALNVISG